MIWLLIVLFGQKKGEGGKTRRTWQQIVNATELDLYSRFLSERSLQSFTKS